MIISTKTPCRFISLGYVIATPLFSPSFFHQLSDQNNGCVSSLIIHFMRGVVTNVLTCEPIPLYQRILTALLFIELNRDESTDIMRDLISELLKRETLAYDKKITADDLLSQIKGSELTLSLKEAACDFIRLVPIECIDMTLGAMYSLQDSSKASLSRALDLNNQGQGIFAPEDWESVRRRFPQI